MEKSEQVGLQRSTRRAALGKGHGAREHARIIGYLAHPDNFGDLRKTESILMGLNEDNLNELGNANVLIHTLDVLLEILGAPD